MESELILSVGGLPPLSARGCIQELVPVEQGKLRRTINGELIFVGKLTSKYRSIIHCTDKTSLATAGLHPGTIVQVGCIQRLWQKILPDPANKPILLERSPVEESISVVDNNQQTVKVEKIKDLEVQLADRHQVYYLSYRPWLTMRAIRYNLQTDEWGLRTSWHLELEEV